MRSKETTLQAKNYDQCAGDENDELEPPELPEVSFELRPITLRPCRIYFHNMISCLCFSVPQHCRNCPSTMRCVQYVVCLTTDQV